MTRIKIRIALIFISILLFKLSHGQSNGNQQKNLFDSTQFYTQIHHQDTTLIHLRNFHDPDSIHFQFLTEPPDTNFTYSKYIEFLEKINDPNKYVVLPINQFRKTFDRKKIVIGLRHDVDLDLNIASQLSVVENNIGFQSSYYILHTAPYYLADKNIMSVHNDSIIPTLKTMQNEYHHEIGWHNDLVTLQLVYKIDPITYFQSELNWLRKNGLNLSGTASHGSNYCYTYKYLNYYFFNEFKRPVVGQFVNNDSVLVDYTMTRISHAYLKDFKLEYEAYFLNNNKYFSDAQYINHERWHPGNLDVSTLVPGDRVIILTHPVYYRPSGSELSNLTSFEIQGQLKSDIDPGSSTVEVEMPAGEKTDRLPANFEISTKATLWLGQRRVVSGLSPIDFTKPVKFRIVAEDGLKHSDWSVNIKFIETKFTVYPNPSTGIVSLHFENITSTDSQLDIYNSAGTVVYSEIINQKGSFTYSRDFRMLPVGIYYLKLTTGNKQMVQRFIRN
jgi:hypothetical protein